MSSVAPTTDSKASTSASPSAASSSSATAIASSTTATSSSPTSLTDPTHFETLFHRSRHAAFVIGLDSKTDSFEYFVGEHLRMSGVYWGVMAMSLIQKLDEMHREEIITFVLSCYDEKIGGFSGNVGHDVHLLYTLSAIQILVIFNALDRLDSEKVSTYIASLQESDGSFRGDQWGEIDTRFSYCAFNALAVLDKMEKINLTKGVEFIARCRNFDGGFGAVPGAESHAGQIFCCVGALAIAGDIGLKEIDRGLLGWWLSERQLPTGGLNGRPEKKQDVCFGIETRVLTNDGFLFLHEIESRLERNEEVTYAAYDENKKEIIYVAGKLRLPVNEEKKVISFNGSGASNFSIRATGAHDMYVQRGNVRGGRIEWANSRPKPERVPVYVPHKKVKASVLFKDQSPVRFLGFASNGVPGGKHELMKELNEKLGITTEEQLGAFLEVYGFWIGDGTMGYGSDNNYIILSQKKADDVAWLLEMLPKCGLVLDQDYYVQQKDVRGHTAIKIKNKQWFTYFDLEYGRKYKNSDYSDSGVHTKSAKWFWWWVFKLLNRAQLRLLIEGLRRADGDWSADHNRIFTSSDTFRDDLMVILLHAGYSPYSVVTYKKDAIRGYTKVPNITGEIYSFEQLKGWYSDEQIELINSGVSGAGLNHRPITATANNWTVGYTDDNNAHAAGFSMPTVDGKSITEEVYDGRLWCVTVEHPDALIIAQRTSTENGVITDVSRPVIIGNCYGWWVLSALSILGHISWIDREALGKYILECQDPEGGGISDRPGNMTDVFHTYFGIAGLSLLGYPNLDQIDPVYALPKHVVQKLKLQNRYSTV